MPLVLSVDLGTTSMTAALVDPLLASVVQRVTRPNTAHQTTEDARGRGWSEWDMDQMIDDAIQAMSDAVKSCTPDQRASIAVIGVTGQQHGVCVAGQDGSFLTPFINWQDRRGQERHPKSENTYLQYTRDLLGNDCWRTAGCLMQPGFSALSLYWLKMQGQLPAAGTACFSADAFISRLTGLPPVTEPSFAGGSGVFRVASRNWDGELLEKLSLPSNLFPPVREADQLAGGLANEPAQRIGIPQGTPVAIGIGDHQASFVGSVSNLGETLVVNVGTGAQVARYTDGMEFQLPVELRPFPISGNLLSNVGLPGGWAYQLLRDWVVDVVSAFGIAPDNVYETLNELAAQSPPDAHGLEVVPTFSGTRSDPSQRGSVTGLSPENLNLACLARGMLNGIAQGLFNGFQQLGLKRPPSRLVAAGNGLRNNPLLAGLVSERFGLTLQSTSHVEEAAVGAALTAAVAAGIYPDLQSACGAIQYASPDT